MKRTNRVLALLLCLTLCLGLFPAAYAEDIVPADAEEAILNAADSDLPVTEIAEEQEPETENDSTAAQPDIQTGELLSDEEDPQDVTAWEILPDPVNVCFLADEEDLLAFLTVTDAFGACQDLYTDPETGLAEFGRYLLLPGEYVWHFHDESGRYADMEESFTVEEGSEWRFLPIYPELACEIYTFSYTYINPIYEGVITEADIPAPSVSEEELAAEVRDFISRAGEGTGRSVTRYESESGILNTTVEEAALELRQQIKDCEDEARIRLITDTKPTAEGWNSLVNQLVEIAFQHTGVPTEGDYLRYEHGGYKIDASAGKDEGSSQYYYEFICTLQHFTTKAYEEELEGVAAGILSDLALDGKSDYEKIQAIYRYLCEHVKYVGGTNLSYTAYAALVQNAAVCQGYSAAFYRLCLAAGVDTRIIQSNTMKHAWNIAKLGSRYYYLDATWDTNYTAANYRYFLKGSETWLSKHKTGGISELGDQFKNAAFASQYVVPEYDYAPLIAKQPENCSVFAGRDVNFAVEATGGELVYQWETSKNNGDTWQNVEGAAGAALSMTALLDDNGRLYRCKISNSAGTLYTESVSLTVNNYTYEFSLNLAELIGINFYVSGADNYDGLTISWQKKDKTWVTKQVTDGLFVKGNKYYFLLETLSSREMTVPIPVVIKDAKENILMEGTCSAKAYRDIVFGYEDAKYDALKELCQATMDYGSFAQIYFNYQTDALANPDVSAESLPSLPESFTPTLSGTCTGIKSESFSLALDAQTVIRFYFIPENSDYTIDQYALTVEDKNGNAVDHNFFTMPDGSFCVTIPGISAIKLGENYNVKLQNKADGTQVTFASSALGYAWMRQTADAKLANVCKALYNYYLKAVAVF